MPDNHNGRRKNEPHKKNGRRPVPPASRSGPRPGSEQEPAQNGKPRSSVSFLADAVPLGIFDDHGDEYPENESELRIDGSIAMRTTQQIHPLYQNELARATELRCDWLEWVRRYLIEVVGCEETVRVLLAVFGKQVTQKRISELVGKSPLEVCREIKRLRELIRKRF